MKDIKEIPYMNTKKVIQEYYNHEIDDKYDRIKTTIDANDIHKS